MGDISAKFSRSEFACHCGCGFNTVDTELLGVLEDVREYFNEPVIISSGCRCIPHNTNVGGAPSSQHTKGRAADFSVKNTPVTMVYAYLDDKYPTKYGLGLYERDNGGWCHIDTRSGLGRRWDK